MLQTRRRSNHCHRNEEHEGSSFKCSNGKNFFFFSKKALTAPSTDPITPKPSGQTRLVGDSADGSELSQTWVPWGFLIEHYDEAMHVRRSFIDGFFCDLCFAVVRNLSELLSKCKEMNKKTISEPDSELAGPHVTFTEN